MNPIDLPQVLDVLRPGVYWGPMAQTGVAYADFAAAWPGGDSGTLPTEQECQTTWDTLEANRPATVLAARRAAAIVLAAAPEAVAQVIRAELLLTMDELNVVRQWVTDFKAATAGAATLAALKTAVAALPNLPQRTAAQIKPQLVTRIGTVDAD